MKKLWEVDHPYYCAESNYFSREPYQSFETWSAFMDGMGSSDPELNLLFRWDWNPPMDEDVEKPQWGEDEAAKESTLQLFFVLQRKGIFACNDVKVARSEEPEIRAWLAGRMPHLLKLWEPLIGGTA